MRPTRVPLLAALLAACLLGCGEPREPGGSGRLEGGEGGAVAVLSVAGSPYQMGWWHGYLLRGRIVRLHEAWERALLEAVLGRPRSASGGNGARAALEQYLDLVLDQTFHRLSERMLQELEGMAAGCGLAKERLVRLDVLRDALRPKGLDARLVGAAGLLPRPGGSYEARAWWSGADTAMLLQDWLVVRRAPEGGRATVVLSWPGSLGAVAGLRDDGLAYLCGEGEVTDRRRMGFGGGRPFLVAARQALAETASAYDLIAETSGTMGHLMLASSVGRRDGVSRVQGLAAFQVYSQPEPEWFLERAPFLAVGPYERLEGPEAVALREAVCGPQLEPDERWLRLRGHADPRGGPPTALHELRITWDGSSGSLEVLLPGGPGASVQLVP